MKKFLQSFILFLFFCTCFYLVALLVMPNIFKKNINYGRGATGNMHNRLEEIKNVDNPELLFLGSSHAYRGFDTRIFEAAGISSFNLGSSSQSPIQTHFLLLKYLESIDPQVIVYEVTPLTFSGDGVESSIDIIANDSITEKTMDMVLETGHYKTTHSFIYWTLRQFLQLDKDIVEEHAHEDDTYIEGGYVERDLSYFSYETYPSDSITFNENQLDHFNDIVDLIEDKDIKQIFVQAPVTHALYNSIENNEEFDSIVESHGHPYINFNEIMHLDDSLHFYDSHHLNQRGVELFNAELIKKLEFL